MKLCDGANTGRIPGQGLERHDALRRVRELDVKAKVAEPTDEVSGGATPVGAVEVVGPEVAVVDRCHESSDTRR